MPKTRTSEPGPRATPVARRVLGIDTSLRSSGIAVVEARGNSFAALDYGVIKNKPGLPLSECLLTLSRRLADMLARHTPGAVAIEGAFYHKNARTAMILGHARGVAIATCADAGVPVYEYAPRKMKQAIVGFGNASKEQVLRMVMTLLALEEEPKEDAADALALALCHLHNRSACAPLAPNPI